jgi:hypothetical protein
MRQPKWFALYSGAFLCASNLLAVDIGGTISSTVTITENSQLVDDVNCTVTGAACIAFGANGITLDLNGFTMTGQAHPNTACAGVTQPAQEFGIVANGFQQVTVAVREPCSASGSRASS